MRKLTKEEFIAKAKEVHGDKYNYSKAVYVNSSTKVEIICPKHGSFKQTPNVHLDNHGCPMCKIEKVRHIRLKDSTSFVKEASLIHSDRYDYSTIKYVDTRTKIDIRCPVHGIFHQRPNDHLQGHGCPKCAREGQKTQIFGVGINDLLNTKGTSYYKAWFAMLTRCYNVRLQQSKCKSYVGCSVCEEWHTLSNFKKWFDDSANGFREGYQLDKDILIKRNKIYSPDTCCFVPTEINSLFTKTNALRGQYPIGVVATPYDKFVAKLSGERTYLGVYDTPELAFIAYKKAKEHQIKELAEKYFNEGKITERVYNALMKYEVEITD